MSSCSVTVGSVVNATCDLAVAMAPNKRGKHMIVLAGSMMLLLVTG